MIAIVTITTHNIQFQLRSSYSVERDQKMITNDESERI